ncbi:MAG: metallophosphoesterase [Geovibrio sp.]|nr:metallophosphoesterase [Geovibrio sp.]
MYISVFVTSISCSSIIRWMSAAVLLAVSMKFFIYREIGGSLSAPAFPQPVMFMMEVLFSSVVVLFLLLIIKDAASAALWAGNRLGLGITMPFSRFGVNMAVLAVSVVIGVYGKWQAVKVPDVKTVNISITGLPDGLDGFSIIQLSDIHIGAFLKKSWLEKVVEKTNAAKPDIIAVTGDMIDGTPEDLREDIAPLAGLRAGYGVYGVTGNHEYYFQAEKWTPVFSGLGIRMLSNEHVVLNVNGSEIVIAGVPDKTEKRFGGLGADIDKTLTGAPETFRLLLAHQPTENTGKADISLQLSGHTHGGHMPFVSYLTARSNGGMLKGLYEREGKLIYVSPGTGIWPGFSFRLGVPSEITRIVLKQQKD